MAFFLKPDGTPVVKAVEVKATEREIKKRYSLPSSQAQTLLKINIPVLVVVVNAKNNDIYFNWIQNALTSEQKEALPKSSTCTIALRSSTPEEREALRREILQ